MQQTAHSRVPSTDGGLPAGRRGFAHPPHNVAHFDIQVGQSVADFGTGSGHYVWPMVEAIGPAGHLFAIDVQQDLLKRVHNEAHKRGLKNVKVIWADLERPKGSRIADQILDLVLMSNLLFQLGKKASVLAEAKRILKPSGRLIVIDWADSYNMMGPHKSDVVTKKSAKTLIRESGFEPVQEFPAGTHHWGIIATPA